MCAGNLYVSRFIWGAVVFIHVLKKVDVLRSKIAWKFISDADSLLHKTLEPRYGSSCWSFDLMKNMSNAWNIILSGAKALKPIVRWKISNGESINVMEDVWILDKVLSKWPTFLSILQGDVLNVDHFIKNGVWDMEELHLFFGKELINLICNIHIDPNCNKDQLELLYQVTGKSLSTLAFEPVVSNPAVHMYWVLIKKINLNLRIEVFWWRLHHKAIPTFHFLEYRRLREGNLCPRGCMKSEDHEHVAVSCPKFIQIVQILNRWGFQILVFETFVECCSKLEQNASSKIFLANLYCSSVFFCWKFRNKFIHGDKEDSNLSIAANSVGVASISMSNRHNSGIWDANQPVRLSRNCWHSPPPDWIKVNVNSSLLTSYKAGGVFRDHKGRFLCIWIQWCSLGHLSVRNGSYLFFKMCCQRLDDAIQMHHY
ncbi:hypothetical protein MA16_Dca026016 [Dendrobium catenatum]|uniref:Uncharacterized protein n=1 Tax=Dendrobium catenatum TaxID=906689 RepID=A0A2I0VDM7_9ASPA|nr:hypothetical protein MA16_Dca026016 [Dendrobium catenatum]